MKIGRWFFVFVLALLVGGSQQHVWAEGGRQDDSGDCEKGYVDNGSEGSNNNGSEGSEGSSKNAESKYGEGTFCYFTWENGDRLTWARASHAACVIVTRIKYEPPQTVCAAMRAKGLDCHDRDGDGNPDDDGNNGGDGNNNNGNNDNNGGGDCTANPAAPGCPQNCAINPSAAGCPNSGGNPTPNACAVNPAAPGCPENCAVNPNAAGCPNSGGNPTPPPNGCPNPNDPACGNGGNPTPPPPNCQTNPNAAGCGGVIVRPSATPCYPVYSAPTAEVEYDPPYPLPAGITEQSGIDPEVTVKLRISPGVDMNCGSGPEPIAKIVAPCFSLADSSIDWITNERRQSVKGRYPICEHGIVRNWGQYGKEYTFKYKPLDPGIHRMRIICVGISGARKDLVVPINVYLLDTSIVK